MWLRRRRTYGYLASFAAAALAACGGLSQKSSDTESARGVGSAGGGAAAGGSGGSGSGTGSGAASSGGAGGAGVVSSSRVPQKHRAQGVACDHERPPGNARSYEEPVPCPEDGGLCQPTPGCVECRAACVDYADGIGPRCVRGEGECLSDADCTAQDNGRCWDNRGRWFCTYDTVYSDATCSSGGPCACEGESGSPGNTCLPGDCQTDADCGSKGYCSPTFGGCGNYSGVIGYYCHTAADTCLDDADCVSPEQGPGYCMYMPDVGHWACGYGQCVG